MVKGRRERDYGHWPLTLAVVLMGLSALVYWIHYLIFRDPHHIFIFMVGDIAFVFLEMLLLTFVIYRLLHHRERKAMIDKVNMLTGAFFSELGTELLRRLAVYDTHQDPIGRHLSGPSDWSEKEFLNLRDSAVRYDSSIDARQNNLEELQAFLAHHKPFLLDLLQNQSLIRAEPFSNLVWAVFHLAKELENHGDLADLSEADFGRLAGDIKRVYQLLLVLWLDYLDHLKRDYPYLFSLAERRNPFRPVHPVEVK